MAYEAFGVDLDALRQAEQGVNDAVAELGEMSGWGRSPMGEQGYGLVDDLVGSAPGVGHDNLCGALMYFANTWLWGVKFLVEDGQDVAEALSDTRSTYQKAEDAALSAIKRGAHLVGGNPMEDDGAWEDKSAREIAGELHPDYSGQSFMDSGGRVAEQGMQSLEGLTGLDVDRDGQSGGGA